MKNLFNSVKLNRPKKSVFDLTHDVKMSLRMGNLYPIMALDCMPGDKIKLSCESLIRFSPLIAPVMHRMSVTMHYFFVPYRILWPGWEKFIINDLNPPAFPYLNLESTLYGTYKLCDYLGLPDPGTKLHQVSAMPFAAYQKIYNEYYRDENLIAPVFEGAALIDGDNSANMELPVLRKRAWQHDYFTSALPFAQKGAAVSLPLGDVVLKDGTEWPASPLPRFESASGVSYVGDLLSDNLAADADIESSTSADTPLAYNPSGTLETESTTINDLRRAFRLQEWLEKNARGGTRYIENILVHFGVKSSDKRLQRPEYITGTKSPVVISEVLNSTGTEDAPQGAMAGHGMSVTTGKYGSYFCEEHGLIMGVMSVMPMTAYQQGIPKNFLKINDAFEYAWPSFAHLGEQPIEQREIYADTINPTQEFGYVPRYSEYKFMNNRVAGDFKTSLSFWHLGRIFESDPALNETFISADPTARVFAVIDPEVDNLLAHVLNKITAVRPLPKFGTPTF